MPEMGVRERVALARRHLDRSLALKGDKAGVLEMRRHLSCYFKGLDNFKEMRIRLVTENDPATLKALLDEVGQRWGDAPAPPAGNIYGL